MLKTRKKLFCFAFLKYAAGAALKSRLRLRNTGVHNHICRPGVILVIQRPCGLGEDLTTIFVKINVDTI